MATAIIESVVQRRTETHHFIGGVAIAFCARFVEETRQRSERRRMLNIVQQLDHPGVLADFEAAGAQDNILRA
jgi:hypothetical protein